MPLREVLPAAAEFFAGIGLVRRALEHPRSRFKWRTVFANDNDPRKHAIYENLFPNSEKILDKRDVAELRARDIAPSDLWTVSFPCTDVSLAGSRQGIRANQSAAVWKVLDLLSQTASGSKPRVLLFENVLGLLSSHGGKDFGSLVSALNDRGYGVDPVRIDAKWFVPQSRQRLFLVATKLDDPAVRLVDPRSLEPSDIRPLKLLECMRAYPSCKWHARELPQVRKRIVHLEQIVEEVSDDDPRWWDSGRTKKFVDQIHPRHIAYVQEQRGALGVSYCTAFRRVRIINGTKKCVAEIRRDGIAGCLRTPKGGSAKQILVKMGGGDLSVRHLTPYECMRLQGWDRRPDEKIEVDDMLFALGDGVCVPAVQWVLEHAVCHPSSASVESIKTNKRVRDESTRNISRASRRATAVG